MPSDKVRNRDRRSIAREQGMKKRITAKQLQQMTTHEVADLLASIVELLRGMPDQRWESVIPDLKYAQKTATPAFHEQEEVRMHLLRYDFEGKVVGVYAEAVEVEFSLYGRRKRILVPTSLPKHVHPRDISHSAFLPPASGESYKAGDFVAVNFDSSSFPGKVGEDPNDDVVEVRFMYNEQVNTCLVHPLLLTRLDTDDLPSAIKSL